MIQQNSLKLRKISLFVMLLLTILGCICYMFYAHRRVIKAIIAGEELPKMAEGYDRNGYDLEGRDRHGQKKHI